MQRQQAVQSQRESPGKQVSYTILLGSDERLFPSYDFIIEQLRSRGVEIRQGFFGETGIVYPTGDALEYMINRQAQRFDVDDEPDQRDVTTMRSGLEVDTAEWLSDNRIPYAHEPFAVPSPFVDPNESRDIIDIIADQPQDEIEARWRRIFNKHNLGEETDRTPAEVLESIDRRFMVPDFATYPDAGKEQRLDTWVGWTDYNSIIEVTGAYTTPPIEDFDSWYRYRSVAQKELAYKLLGEWENTVFILTDDEGIPSEVREDEHYLIINPTQVDSGMDRLSRVIRTQ
jgi:hypothetical protein